MAQLPTTGITVSLVAQTLGVGTTDIGRLCTSDRINKWAKYKPIDNDSPVFPDWVNSDYANDDGMCGLNIGAKWIDLGNMQWTYTTIRDTYNDPNQWGYVKAAKRYRLGDFRGYQHESLCPFRSQYKKGFHRVYPFTMNSITTEYNVFGITLDNENDLPHGNLTIDDIPFRVYDGEYLYFRDAKLCVMILIGDDDPLDENSSWTSSFTHGNCIFTSEDTVSQGMVDGSLSVSVPVSYFVNIANYRTHTYTVIAGFLFGNNYFVPLPYDNDHYPIIQFSFEATPQSGFSGELIGWAQNPVYSSWNDVKWVYTEDMCAIRPIGQTYLQLKLHAYYLNFTSGGDPIDSTVTLSAQNLRATVSAGGGWNKTGQAAVINDNFQPTSVSLRSNQNEPTEFNVSLDDLVPSGNEGTEFLVTITYTPTNRVLLSMDFRYTSDY